MVLKLLNMLLLINNLQILAAIFVLLTHCLCSVLSVACLGCVDLDELSFDKTVRRFPYALVKFDIAFPYGEKHTAFAALSRSAHLATEDLLVATVGIKDYGEMENKELGLRFGYTDKNLPGIILFKAGDLHKPVKFPSYLDVTEENLKQFINEETTLYIGCDGCMKEYNEVVKNFAKLPEEERLKVIEQLETMQQKLKKADDVDKGKVYVAFARKIQSSGYSFVNAETKRLNRLKAGRIKAEKKAELQRKLNVLALFRVASMDKDEL